MTEEYSSSRQKAAGRKETGKTPSYRTGGNVGNTNSWAPSVGSRSSFGQETHPRIYEGASSVRSLQRIEDGIVLLTQMMQKMHEEFRYSGLHERCESRGSKPASESIDLAAQVVDPTSSRAHQPPVTSSQAARKVSIAVFAEANGEHSGRADMREVPSRIHKDAELVAVPTAATDGFVAPALPLNWPTTVEKKGNLNAPAAAEIDWLRHRMSTMDVGSWQTTKIEYSAPMWCSFIQDPNSSLNIALELLGVFILAYDLVAAPYILAWDVKVVGIFEGLSMMSLFFWTIDVVMSMFRGYFRDGELIHTPWLVATRYARTWFLPDVSIVLSEWASVLLAHMEVEEDSDSGSLKILRLAKMGKLLRLLGALRIFRLARFVESFIQRSISENVRMAVQIGALSFAFLWLNHMVTCAWYGIGRAAPTGTSMRWVNMEWSSTGAAFQETNRVYQYLTSFHWAMAQTTLGAMEVTPTNSYERSFNVFCLMVGLLFGSTLISSLSATMVEVQVRNRDRHQKLSSLRRYLNENCINRELALKVQRQVADRLAVKSVLQAKDVTALETLSLSLQQDLHTEICKHHMSKHAMIRTWGVIDPTWFRKFCVSAVNIHASRKGDELFLAGSDAKGTHHIISGLVAYTQEPETSPVRDTETTIVGDKLYWLCESALWSHWTHVGTAQVTTNCQCAFIDPDLFWESLKKHMMVAGIAQEYCTCYHVRIVTAKPPEGAWPNDIWVPYTDQGDIVFSMSPEVQKQIGLAALNMLQPSGVQNLVSGSSTAASRAKLLQEVMDAKSVVILNGKGRPERVVSLVILRLVGEEGDSLYQVASVDEDGELKVDCRLPGVKRTRDELTSDALMRLVKAKLPAFNDKIVIKNVETKVEEKESKDYAVHTTYLRKICQALLKGGASLEDEELKPGVEVHFGPLEEVNVPRRSLVNAHVHTGGLMGRKSVRGSLSTTGSWQNLSELASRKVYYSQQAGNEGGLFMWLPEIMAEWLTTPTGEQGLARLVRSIERPRQNFYSSQDGASSMPSMPALSQSAAVVDDCENVKECCFV